MRSLLRHHGHAVIMEALVSLLPAIPAHTWLAHTYGSLPLIHQYGGHVRNTVPYLLPHAHPPSVQAVLFSLDNGNDAFKGTVRRADEASFCTQRITTAYAPARTIRLGERIATWQVQIEGEVHASEAFWMGEDAASAEQAESLPIGLTAERLEDSRYRHFLCACLVETLFQAHYSPDGDHALFMSLGVPNEEVEHHGVREEVKGALRHLLDKRMVVQRTDPSGQTTTWSLKVVEIAPYAQTCGSFFAWYYTLDGTPVETDIVEFVVLDFGGGHLHQCDIQIVHRAGKTPSLRMAAKLLGEGTVGMARALKEALRGAYPGLSLTDVEAQQVLISGYVTAGGRRTPVQGIVREIVQARAQHTYTTILPVLQRSRSYLMFTGGGTILLAESLQRLVATKRQPTDVLFVPPSLASVLNSIGGYMVAYTFAQRLWEQARASSNGSEI